MRRWLGSWLKDALAFPPLQRLAGLALRRRHSGSSERETWERKLGAESDFWRRFIIEEPGEVSWRTDPTAAVPERSPLYEVLAGIDQEHVKILDVGAGPLTCVGFTYPGKTLEITATDPLAESYDRILAEFGIEPPVRTIHAEGERLVEQFGRERFDVAVAYNALDHCHDPVGVVQSMLGTVRPGGHVVLLHRRNEGQHQFYRGLHRWNIDCRDGHLVIWRPRDERDVTELLDPHADVRAAVDDDAIVADIVKRARPG